MDRLGIYPWPQWLDCQQGSWPLPTAGLTLWLGETARPIREGIDRLASLHGLPVGPAEGAGAPAVAVGGVDEPAIAARLQRHPELRPETLPAEGYLLAIDQAGVTVGGADSHGCLYGFAAAMQVLVSAGSEGALPWLEVRDWPYKPMRGAHFYLPGRDNLPFFRDVLAWMASLRYNTLFLEVGGAMRYHRHPEINEGWARLVTELRALPGGPPGLNRFVSVPKDSPHTETGRGGWLEQAEVAELVQYARSLGIEVIPELQSLSHAYYLLAAHPELAERAWDPWPDTYCPSDPRSYELYFDVLEEAIEVFQPRMVHIGHDEAYTFGVCDRCRNKSGADLLAGDLNRIHGFLASKGIRTVLWADKLESIITGGVDHGGRARRSVSAARQTDYTMRETYQAVDFVPKDMLAMDWYWCLDQHSERYLLEKGFEVIFGNFGDNYQPQTFLNWDIRSASDRVVGAEVSTWCDVSEYALGHNRSLFNLLFSANMLWWRHYRDRERQATLDEVARRQPLARSALGGSSLPSLGGGESRTIALGHALNAVSEVVSDAAGEWTGTGGVPFELSQREAQVSGQSPDSPPVPIGGPARSLVFLHYCRTARRPKATWTIPDPLGRDDGSRLGYYRVTYDDGMVETVELCVGDNIALATAAFGDDTASSPFWGQPAWTGRDREGRAVTLWAHEWVNPKPEQPIADVRLHLEAADQDDSISLLALTAVI